MTWYKELYLGDKARDRKFHIIGKIGHGKFLRNAYVITLPEEGHGLLNIFPSYILYQEYYQKKDLLVVGIALGYDEALETVRRMVDDVYSATGNFNMKAYFQ